MTMSRQVKLSKERDDRIFRSILGYPEDAPLSDPAKKQFLASNPSKEMLYASTMKRIEEGLQARRGGVVKLQQGGTPTKATDEEIQKIGQELLGRDFRGGAGGGLEFYKDYTPEQVRSMVGASEEAAQFSKKQRGVPDQPTAQPVQAQTIQATPEQDVKFDPVTFETAKGVTATGAEAQKQIDPREAAKIDPTKAGAEVAKEAEKLKAVQGEVSNEAIAQAQTVNATETAIKDAQASKITQAVQIDNVPKRQVQAEEMIDGPSVKMARVEEEIDKAKAAQAGIDPKATIQGQLNELYQNFETGNPPAWAAASMRNVTAILNQRGLGASSIAGQAIIQAQMEAALPIAQQDAQTIANLNIQNLSNRQQIAVIGAEQRAKFLGIEFDQAFQTKVANASRIADIANQNFSAEVQVTLENAKMAQTVDLANLNNDQAITMAKVAQMANLETANLNNRQQAAVQNAQAFLQMDVANLSNAQQTALFKSEKTIQAMLTDQAAENAAKQFNASSENQVNQFYDSLTSQISQFNITQQNALERFNVEQTNALESFNVQQKNAQEQFNASNGLVISQANAEWRRNIATANTQIENQVNQFNATQAMALTMREYEGLWQEYRDKMAFAFESADNEADRYVNMAIATMSADADIKEAQLALKAGNQSTAGKFVEKVFGGAINKVGNVITEKAGDILSDLF
ncbi:MAG: hypothetical protein CME98_25345 [Hyphomonas sp.]|nr:hypothetical protein [Hyphomonas sp.]